MRLLAFIIPLVFLAFAAVPVQAATNVTLVSPANGNVSYVTTGYANYSFNCSASDNVQLANFSLWINSTGAWAENQSQNKTGTWNFSEFNLSLGPGYYIWNCRVADNSSNYTFSPQNWTILVSNVTDTYPPNVTLVSPEDGNQSNTFTAINYTFNCSASDNIQLANISLWINSTGNWSLNQTQPVSGAWNFSIFNLSLGQGYYVWNCQSGDNSSNHNFSSQNRTISITATDITSPDLWFTSPSGNQTITSNDWIFVNMSANESLNVCLLDWYNGTWQNVSMNVTGQYCYANMTGLGSGSYYFRIYGNDSAGNMNVTEDRQVNLDATYPLINITSPLNGTNYSSTSLALNFTYNESNPHTCWYQYNSTNTTLGNCTGTNFTALDHQLSELWVWMNDTAGNLNSSEVIFSVCTESWSCSDWSTCSGGIQSRTCTDSYSCGTIVNRPALSQSCSLGGGGGGGGTAVIEPPQVQKTWEKIEPGAAVSFSINKSGLEFSEIKIAVNNPVNNISITVTKLELKPAEVSQVSGKVYQYVSVNATNLNSSNLNSTGIRFRVSKFWITQNSIDRNRVYLNRYGPLTADWNRLNTTYDGEDSQNVYYLAESPGFSYFVITGEIRAPGSPAQNQTQAECNNNGACDAGENETICPADCRPQKQCEAGMFMCHGSVLEGCSQDGKWVAYKICENGCLNARCLEAAAEPIRIPAIIIIIASGVIAIAVELILWRKKFSPWRYFRI